MHPNVQTVRTTRRQALAWASATTLAAPWAAQAQQPRHRR